MKKLVTSLLIVVLLFNFIFCQKYFVLAEDDEELRQHKVANESMVLSNTVGVELMEEGAVSQKQGSATKTTLIIGAALGGLGACISGLLTRLINIFVVQIDLMIGAVTISEETRDGDADDHFWFTIDRCVFNRIPLFNINYFHTGDYYVGETKITTSGENQAIKEGIATAYQISRMLAIIMSLLVLIYIGIRMALSTVASEQAKYKKMLVSWIESVIILFCTVYIISAIITFGEVITSMLYEIRVDMIESGEGYDIFENTIRWNTFFPLFNLVGFDLTMWSIIYWCLLFSEFKFFWLYAKRLLMVGLLIIISPLIIITYSIDKAGDGRAQVFSSWMKEFLVNVLIQPLHALIYLVCVLSANTIATESPIVALALLMSMGSVERMVKIIFDMKGLTTLRGVNKFMKKEG